MSRSGFSCSLSLPGNLNCEVWGVICVTFIFIVCSVWLTCFILLVYRACKWVLMFYYELILLVRAIFVFCSYVHWLLFHSFISCVYLIFLPFWPRVYSYFLVAFSFAFLCHIFGYFQHIFSPLFHSHSYMFSHHICLILFTHIYGYFQHIFWPIFIHLWLCSSRSHYCRILPFPRPSLNVKYNSEVNMYKAQYEGQVKVIEHLWFYLLLPTWVWDQWNIVSKGWRVCTPLGLINFHP